MRQRKQWKSKWRWTHGQTGDDTATATNDRRVERRTHDHCVIQLFRACVILVTFVMIACLMTLLASDAVYHLCTPLSIPQRAAPSGDAIAAVRSPVRSGPVRSVPIHAAPRRTAHADRQRYVRGAPTDGMHGRPTRCGICAQLHRSGELARISNRSAQRRGKHERGRASERASAAQEERRRARSGGDEATHGMGAR